MEKFTEDATPPKKALEQLYKKSQNLVGEFLSKNTFACLFSIHTIKKFITS